MRLPVTTDYFRVAQLSYFEKVGTFVGLDVERAED